MERRVKQPAAFTITTLLPRAFIQCLKAKSPPQPAQVGVPGSTFSSGGMSLIDLMCLLPNGSTASPFLPRVLPPSPLLCLPPLFFLFISCSNKLYTVMLIRIAIKKANSHPCNHFHSGTNRMSQPLNSSSPSQSQVITRRSRQSSSPAARTSDFNSRSFVFESSIS